MPTLYTPGHYFQFYEYGGCHVICHCCTRVVLLSGVMSVVFVFSSDLHICIILLVTKHGLLRLFSGKHQRVTGITVKCDDNVCNVHMCIIRQI